MDKFAKTARTNTPAQQPATRTAKRLRAAKKAADAEHIAQQERHRARRALRRKNNADKLD